MAALTGKELAQGIRQKVDALKKVCEKVGEDAASRAPAGRWSPKEILSHLLGPEGAGHLPTLQAFIDRETPELDLEPENPFYTERRCRLTFHQLLSDVEQEYERISRFAEGLSRAELDRKAQIPMLKDSPLGEYPTLEGWIGGLGGYHLQFHTDHMQQILQGLAIAAAPKPAEWGETP